MSLKRWARTWIHLRAGLYRLKKDERGTTTRHFVEPRGTSCEAKGWPRKPRAVVWFTAVNGAWDALRGAAAFHLKCKLSPAAAAEQYLRGRAAGGASSA